MARIAVPGAHSPSAGDFEFKTRNHHNSSRDRVLAALLGIALACTISSCSKKPAESYNDGIKAIAANDYARAQDYFADGIKNNGDMKLYAGFIAADLVTGKYPAVISAYNALSDSIHSSLVQMYGARVMKIVGISSKIIPYNTSGGNKIPPDFPDTIVLQCMANYQQYLVMKQQIENAIGK
jgi:hypothetical protein